jgi:hypothetical protein
MSIGTSPREIRGERGRCCCDRKTEQDAEQRQKPDLNKKHTEDKALRCAYGFIDSDGHAPPLDECRNRICDTNAAGEHGCKPGECEELGEALQHVRDAGRGIGGVAYEKTCFRKPAGKTLLKRRGHRARRLDPVAPADETSGLDKPGFIQCGDGEQEASSERRPCR